MQSFQKTKAQGSPQNKPTGKVGYYNRIYFRLPEEVQEIVDHYLGITEITRSLQRDTIKLLKCVSFDWRELKEEYSDDEEPWLGENQFGSIRGEQSFQFYVYDQGWCECSGKGAEKREWRRAEKGHIGKCSHYTYLPEPEVTTTTTTTTRKTSTTVDTIVTTVVTTSTPFIISSHRKLGRNCSCHLIFNSDRLYRSHVVDEEWWRYKDIQVAPVIDYEYDPRIEIAIQKERDEEWKEYQTQLERGSCVICNYMERECHCEISLNDHGAFYSCLFRSDTSNFLRN